MVIKPIKRSIHDLFAEFFESEKASAISLIFCTLTSIVIANSAYGGAYIHFWHTSILGHSLQHWINDGLMAIFFLLVGLEIERELYVGELSAPKSASLPFAAALGGMVTPALLHFFLNQGTETLRGAGIPMATDIAFALGVLALLGNKIPMSLKVFLSALAIIDDLGAIVIIAIFYVAEFSLPYFLSALAVFAGLVILNRLRVTRLSVYLLLGAIMWWFMLKSGVHATVAGVLLAFAVPFRNGTDDSPSYRLQHFLEKSVGLVIMPLFALANTGITLTAESIDGLMTRNSLGIVAGLLAGKPLGIVLFSFVAVKLGMSHLPSGVDWKHILGVGFLGGIGFTMSIFITLLAFSNDEIIQTSELSIVLASVLAGTIGYLILKRKSNLSPTPPAGDGAKL